MRLAFVLALASLTAPAAHAQWVRIDSTRLPRSSIFAVSAVVASDEAVHALAGFNPARPYRSTDDGETWALVEPVAAAGTLYGAEATVVAHLPGTSLHVSVDDGASWTERSAAAAPLDGYFVGLARADGNGRSHAVLSNANRLFVTRDDFATLEPKLPAETFFRVASNGGVFVATTGSAPDARYFRSADGGQTWTGSAATGLGSQFLYSSRDSFFVSGISTVTGTRVLVASADGAAWTEVAAGAVLTVAPVLASSARHATVATFAQGTDLRVRFYTSVQSGRAPAEATGDYPTSQVGPNRVPCVPTGSFVAASSQFAYALAQCTRAGETVLNALYRRPIEGAGSTAAEGSGAPVELGLDVPAPHPLRAGARVRYTTEAGVATLTLYDALGRRVALLASGPHADGDHTAALDARGLAPGAYVLRLSTSRGSAARVVTVVR